MSYSLARHPNKPYEFPAPPAWLVWIQEYKWDRANERHVLLDEGQVRHVADLSKAKRRVSDYTRYDFTTRTHDGDKFGRGWAIYLWDQEKGEYALQYEGKIGEVRDKHPLFAQRLKGVAKHQPRPGLEAEVQEAVESIAKTLQGVA